MSSCGCISPGTVQWHDTQMIIDNIRSMGAVSPSLLASPAGCSAFLGWAGFSGGD